MGSRRRRHHHHGRWVVPAVAPAAAAFAAAGLLFLVVAFHCFLSPPQSDDGGGGASGSSRVFRRPNPPFLLNKPAEVRRNVIGAVDFAVPSGGSKLGEQLWESKAAGNFFGCSNATKQFADAEAVTKSDRYLMIATSGGLNQQRTGGELNKALWNSNETPWAMCVHWNHPCSPIFGDIDQLRTSQRAINQIMSQTDLG